MRSETLNPPVHRAMVAVYCLEAFAVGALVMAFEMIASRFLTPVFGSSIITWAALITVVMVAMAVGYFFGGYAADRWPTARAAGVLLFCSALASLAVPGHVVPRLPGIAAAFGDGRTGAMIGAGAVAFLPALFLSTFAPYAIRLSLTGVHRSGATAGLMYAVSTAGSVAGTLVTAFYLVPQFGSARITYALSAATCLASLILMALPEARARRSREGVGAYAAMAICLSGYGVLAVATAAWQASLQGGVSAAPATAAPHGTLGADGAWAYLPTKRANIVTNVESEYNTIFVERKDPYLCMYFARNERLYPESVWNTADPDDLPVFYTRLVQAALLYPDTPLRLLDIGSGAGITSRHCRRLLPSLEVTAVELDPEVIRVSAQHFGVRDEPGYRVIPADGRLFLIRSTNQYDVVLIDAYRGGYVPFHLLTQEFFSLVRTHLAPGGCMVANLHAGTKLVDAVLRTVHTSFRTVDAYYDLTVSSNLVIVAHQGPSLPSEHLAARAAAFQAAHPLRYDMRELVKYRAPFSYQEHGPLLNDDFAPVEYLHAIQRHNVKTR